MRTHILVETLALVAQLLGLVGLFNQVDRWDVFHQLHVKRLGLLCSRYAKERDTMKGHGGPVRAALTNHKIACRSGAVEIMQTTGQQLAGGILIPQKARLVMQREPYLVLAVLVAIGRTIATNLDTPGHLPVGVGI